MAFSLQGNSFATSDVKTLPVGAARLQRSGRHLLRLGGRLQTFDLLGGVCPLHRGDHILTATKPNDTSRSQIPSDSIASISSDNLLGSTKFLQINKGTRHDLIQSDATVKSADTRQFDALIQQGYNVLDSLQVILGKVQDIVGQYVRADCLYSIR